MDSEVSPGLLVRYCHRVADVSVSPTLLRVLMHYISCADVVHLSAVYSFPTIPTLLACKILHKPLVWSPRGALQRWKGARRMHLKAAWELACGIAAPKRLVLHVTSEQELRDSRARLPGVEAVVIPNGVEMPQRVSHRKNEYEWRFAYLGRLDPIKGIENLLEGYDMVRRRLDRASSLVIAGDGDKRYAERIAFQVRERNLAPKVQMIGHVSGDAKKEFFEHTDVLIAPSHTENFGFVVAEALAHGVPVIASRGTPWSRVEDIGCGLWVDNDSASLATAMKRIIAMPLHEMGRRGREWMESEFAWDTVAHDMVRVYHDLLSRAS